MSTTENAIDLETAIKFLLSEGLSDPQRLCEAIDGLTLIEDCVVLDDSPRYADDGYHTLAYDADEHDASSAAEAYIEGGDWGYTSEGTTWVNVHTWRNGIDSDGDDARVEEETISVAIDPEEPECVDNNEHQWKSPYSIVGGIKENPGVWGNGGGVIINEVCMLCGCKKITNTWAQNPENGEQGLDSVSYETDAYSEEINSRLIAKAKEALGEDADTEGYEEDAKHHDFVWVNDQGELVGCDTDELREYGVRLQVDGDDADKPSGTRIEPNE